MLKSEVERVVRKSIEETKAEFTEQQVEALCLMILRITETQIEEGFANNSGRGGRGR